MTTFVDETRGVPAAPADQPVSTRAGALYRAIWRWHFYAGVYVVPFLIMLALTGLVMLYQPQIEAVQYRDRLFVAPQAQALPYAEQLDAVRRAYPDAEVSRFRPGETPDRSSEVAVSVAGRDLSVYVNPYTAAVLGEVDNAARWGTVANTIHGTLLLGQWGDRLIEIAAGWTVVLIVTGLYLWWPRNGGVYRSLVPRWNTQGRALWRSLHSSVGAWLAVGLVFFAVTGMTWTGIWGEQVVQAWNTFPAAQGADAFTSTPIGAINREGEKLVPWNLEQTPLPQSAADHEHHAGMSTDGAASSMTLDAVIALARANNPTPSFWVALPQGPTGVWTVSGSTMSGDATDARQDFTMHIDQHSGAVLGDVRWQDYNLAAKSMAAGIALHQGQYGWWNLLANTLFCLGTVFIALSGVVMWWLRRPKGALRLAAPPVPQNLPLWKGAIVIIVVLGLLFPLVGVSLVVVLALDWLVLSRVPMLKRALT